MKIRLVFLLSGLLALMATIVGAGAYFLTVRRLVYDQATSLTRDTSEYFGDTISRGVEVTWKSVELLSGLETVQSVLRQPPAQERLMAATKLLEYFRNMHQASRCFLLDRAGQVVAASSESGEATPLGKDFSKRPFVRQALAWKASIQLSEGVTSRKGEINFTYPIISGEAVAGAVVMTVPVVSLAQGILRSSGIVALLDENNIVFASSHKEWLFKALEGGGDEELAAIAKSGTTMSEMPTRLAVTLDEAQGKAFLPGRGDFLFSRYRLENPGGWQVVYFYSTGQLADRLRAGLFGKTGLLMAGMEIFVLCASVFLFYWADGLWRQRAEAERKYKAANAFLTQLFDVAADGMLVVDRKFTIIRANETFARMTGLDVREIVGRKCHEVLWSPNCGKEKCSMTQVLAGAKRVESEELVESAAGRQLNCWITAIPIHDSNGKISGVLQSYRDITERVENEVAMEKAIAEAHAMAGELAGANDRMHRQQAQLTAAYDLLKQTQSQILQQEKMASIGQLAAGVAHEINNPMGFISSNINTFGKYMGRLAEFVGIVEGLLPEQQRGGEVAAIRKRMKIDHIMADAKELLKESQDGAERVKAIVQGLKSFSRVDQAERMAADINECLESTIKIAWNELKYKCAVKKEYGALSQTVCNPQQLNQVFMNLLINAAQSIAEHGEIALRTWEADGWINVRISDTGCGIPPEGLKRIFEPFYTTKEVGKGTGLGLSIVYDIVVKKHKGDIQVESEVGRGTTFTVRIPVVPAEAEA